MEAWRAELQEALSFSPSHLSLYQLTIEPDTVFHKLHSAGRLEVPGPELAADMFELTQEMTWAAGLPAYEVSNHARPGQESQHNLVYWRYGEYVGVGPGAHGRVVANGRRLATVTERHPEAWAGRVESDGHGIVTRETISKSAAADEMLLMGLRLAEGLDLGRLAETGGVTVGADAIRRLVKQGALGVSVDGQTIRAVGPGRLLINELVLQLSESFLPLHSSR